jgi:hypothetical protein
MFLPVPLLACCKSIKIIKKKKVRFDVFVHRLVFVNFMRQNNNNSLIGNVLNEDHKFIIKSLILRISY